ncbi:FliM/FliN family flagellar motor C-terminal domain-containing protein [Photobacterium leiognathi]|uniref:FliM/FliN family flagellar motor C-terminal domain-containing protein n=1 Tax=Photobacterium leiognathi TaxID=553611 RepID=UPI0029814D21|nr:FliM/FliN family flagellar motor C-terminal domain-containing protein [Photobacterium leiognathi]
MEVKKNNKINDEKSMVSLSHFSKMEVELEVKIGSVKTDFGSLMNIKAGDTLKSEVMLDDKVKLILDGNTVAEGILIEEDGYFSFQITSIKK